MLSPFPFRGAVCSTKLLPGPGKERDSWEARMGEMDSARTASGRRSAMEMPTRSRFFRLMLGF